MREHACVGCLIFENCVLAEKIHVVTLGLLTDTVESFWILVGQDSEHTVGVIPQRGPDRAQVGAASV